MTNKYEDIESGKIPPNSLQINGKFSPEAEEEIAKRINAVFNSPEYLATTKRLRDSRIKTAEDLAWTATI